jgi:catechol 2,3-dioxygenase-like lactoylglutathione lyase family enzyme
VPKPALRLTSVTLHAADSRALADFYSRLLGWPVAAADPEDPEGPGESGWVQLRPPPGEVGPRLNFDPDPQYVAPVWPSRPGEQQAMEHLDIEVDDLDAALEWALAAGATLAEHQPDPQVRVCFDPAGHPFCLFL